jgi:hypothetical protein
MLKRYSYYKKCLVRATYSDIFKEYVKNGYSYFIIVDNEDTTNILSCCIESHTEVKPNSIFAVCIFDAIDYYSIPLFFTTDGVYLNFERKINQPEVGSNGRKINIDNVTNQFAKMFEQHFFNKLDTKTYGNRIDKLKYRIDCVKYAGLT